MLLDKIPSLWNRPINLAIIPATIAFVIGVSGCMTIPPGDPFEKRVRQLVGENIETTIYVLGSPEARITHESTSYLLYQKYVTGTEVGVALLPPLILPGKSTYVYCYLLEFDERNIFCEYHQRNQYPEFLKNCREAFPGIFNGSIEQ